jgi:hypothetical protein
VGSLQFPGGNLSGNIEKITIENVNCPGDTSRVRKDMYEAMRKAMWKVLPVNSPGLTQVEIFEAVIPYLPEDLFPEGAKAGWWSKAVQLDQEAKGNLVREKTKPLRWYRVS